MLDAIKKRRSIRKYKDKVVEKEKIDEVLKAAMFAPSGNNTRPWEFVVVTDKEKRKKLAQMKQWSYFCDLAPAVLVLCCREDRLWVENMAIAAENICLEAVNQGLGTCIMQVRESAANDGSECEGYVRKLLSIPEDVRILFLISLGYPDEVKDEHDDSEFEKVKIHLESW